jgi:hypothetical protein
MTYNDLFMKPIKKGQLSGALNGLFKREENTIKSAGLVNNKLKSSTNSDRYKEPEVDIEEQ